MFKKILYGIGGIFLLIAITSSTSNQKTTDNITIENAEIATTTETVVTSTEPMVAEVKTTQPEKYTPSLVTPTDPQYEYYSVSSVVDGDTIKININGLVETLRLIGIDTPETVDPRKPVQCFGQEASSKAKELLSGKKVRIEKDSTQGDRDKYDRLLAYVYREDGLFFNKYMVEQGYAHEYTYDLPYKYQAEFKATETYARENQLGLWSLSTCNGDTTSEPIPSEQTITITQTAGRYYTSSYSTSKYYYPEPCSGWKSLSKSYLKSFDSLEALLAVYPARTLSPQCQ